MPSEHCQPARWTCPSRSVVLSLPLFPMPIHNATRSRGCPTSTPRVGFSPLPPNCDCVQAITVLTTGSHTAPERVSPPLPSRGRAIFVHKYEYAMALVLQVSVAASIPKIRSGPLACHASPWTSRPGTAIQLYLVPLVVTRVAPKCRLLRWLFSLAKTPS